VLGKASGAHLGGGTHRGFSAFLAQGGNGTRCLSAVGSKALCGSPGVCQRAAHMQVEIVADGHEQAARRAARTLESVHSIQAEPAYIAVEPGHKSPEFSGGQPCFPSDLGADSGSDAVQKVAQNIKPPKDFDGARIGRSMADKYALRIVLYRFWSSKASRQTFLRSLWTKDSPVHQRIYDGVPGFLGRLCIRYEE